MKIYFSFLIIILLLFSRNAFSQGLCPSVNAGANATICNGQCTRLLAAAQAGFTTNSYTVAQLPYGPTTFTGTPILINMDDIWSQAINIGFNFCYFGNTYSNLVIGANGQISFNTSLANSYNSWSITKPVPDSSNGKNTISVAYRDINPSLGGSVYYKVTGTAPCRTFVVSWVNIPLFSTTCTGISNSTYQAVLYETSNIIDIYIQNSSACTVWNGGKGIIGIQDITGTNGVSPPSRNYPFAWTASNEAWRFSPTGVPSYTVTWSDSGGLIGTGDSITVCPSANTTYTAAMSIARCGGGTLNFTDSVTVNVNSVTTSTPSIIVNSSTVCIGGSATLTATGGSVYSWSPVNGINNPNGSTVIATPTATTVYTVTGSAGSCADTAIAVVNVSYPPLPSVSMSNDSLCSAGTVTLSATGGVTYTWSPAATLSSSSGTVVTASPTITTTYSLLTSSTGCPGTASTTFSLIVINPISSGTLNVTQPMCTGSCNGSITVSLTGGGGNHYQWSNGSISSAIGSLCANTYTVTITDALCASTFTASATLINPPPVGASPTAAGNTCLLGGNGSVTVTPSGGSGSPYTYSINGGSYISSNVFSGLTSGTYTVAVKDNKGCIKTAVVSVPQTGNTSPPVQVNSDTICVGDFVNLTATGANTYTWAPATFLSGTTGANVTSTPTLSLNYTVTGTAANNCRGTALAQILVSPTYTVFSNGTSVCQAPPGEIKPYTSFSPNGDGLNDFFEIDNIEQFASNHVYIYNRWGQLLWDKTGYDNVNTVWEGKDAKGNILPPGTYYYLIEISGRNTLKNWVELMK